MNKLLRVVKFSTKLGLALFMAVPMTAYPVKAQDIQSAACGDITNQAARGFGPIVQILNSPDSEVRLEEIASRVSGGNDADMEEMMYGLMEVLLFGVDELGQRGMYGDQYKSPSDQEQQETFC